MNKPRRARPVSELLKPALADALKARGFAAADILTWWDDIAGERLAAQTVPLEIQWPPRPKGAAPDAPTAPATLILKVESAFAFEVDMAAAQIIDRINAVFGWRCIGRIRLRQGPVERHAANAPIPAPTLPAEAERRLTGSLAGIENDGLREALARLGRGVLAKKPVTRP